jgi:hypothetical protein
MAKGNEKDREESLRADENKDPEAGAGHKQSDALAKNQMG